MAPLASVPLVWHAVFDLMAFIIIPLLVPCGVLFSAATVVARLRAARGAHTRCARNYWLCQALAHLLFTYAALVLTLMAVDSLAGHALHLASSWPSLMRWAGVAGEAHFLLLLDVAGALACALVVLGAAHCFGHVDEANIWHPPRRLRCSQDPARAAPRPPGRMA